MLLKNKKKVGQFIIRHEKRIENKGANLIQEHTDTLTCIEKLQVKLNLLKNTYGFFKCLTNNFLKNQIAKIKKIIKTHKSKCRDILSDIMVWEHTCQYPYY